MNGGIADDPLTRSLLRHLATARGNDDPLGSLARAVLDGDMTLREAADNPWHSQALATAAQQAQTDFDHMTPQQRGEMEHAADRLAARIPEEDQQ